MKKIILISCTCLWAYCPNKYDDFDPNSDGNGVIDWVFIESVKLGTIQNLESGGFEQEEHTIYTEVDSLQIGDSDSISITADGSSHAIAAWIDYNQNKIFEIEERLGNSAVQIGAFMVTEEFPFVVPQDAKLGLTKMRVRTALNFNHLTGEQLAEVDPCDKYNHGETEDYNIFIVSGEVANSSTGQNSSVGLSSSNAGSSSSEGTTGIYTSQNFEITKMSKGLKIQFEESLVKAQWFSLSGKLLGEKTGLFNELSLIKNAQILVVESYRGEKLKLNLSQEIP